jgi:hypothetical protein
VEGVLSVQDWAEIAQLQDWLARANARPRRVLGCAPTDRITGMAINPDFKEAAKPGQPRLRGRASVEGNDRLIIWRAGD